MSSFDEIDRRRALSLAAAAAASTLIPDAALAQVRRSGAGSGRATGGAGTSAGPAATGGRFFTPHELRTLDELAEAIIPADESSGGAKAAGVAELIDRLLGEAVDPRIRQSWRDDLAEIDRVSRGMLGKPFVAATPAERLRFMQRISRNEGNPKEAVDYAFGTIKWEVSWGYYKSKIGIHDELKYQGNTLLDEFVGTDVSRA